MTPTPVAIERILCPTDFSECSALALRHALVLARQFKARLKVLHVVPHVMPARDAVYFAAPWLIMTPEMRSQADDEMRRFLEPLREARVDHEIEITEGEVWREIVAVAEEMSPDLVVMGTHGRSGLEHLFLGSVTERVIPRLPCPVFTVSHEEGRFWEAPGLVTRILCATDFSQASTEALAFALSLARENRAEVTLLNVIESIPEPGEPAYFTVPELAPLQEKHERLARERLQELLAAAGGVGANISARAVVGRAYKEILRTAAEERSDLIVIGAQGHGALEHLLFGSNALHVIRSATCPVLTFRPKTAGETPSDFRSKGLTLSPPVQGRPASEHRL